MTPTPAPTRPPRLLPGDTIGLINPSGAVYERAPYDDTHARLKALGFQVKEGAHLRARYGLTPELMIMMRYSLDDWLALGLDEETLAQVDDAQWPRLFGTVSRVEVRAAIAKCASNEAP